MNRLGLVTKGLASLCLLAIVVAGIPYALWHFIGWPLPHQIPAWSQLRHALDQHGIANRTLIDALSVVVWLTWIVLITSIAVELPAALSGRRSPRLPVAGIFQPVSGRLVGAIIVAFLALAPRSSHDPATAPLGPRLAGHATHPITALVSNDIGSQLARSDQAVLTDFTTGAPSVRPESVALDEAVPSTLQSVQSAPSRASATSDYIVERGDTLWGIAERQLGDPLRWSEIYQLNAGRPQPGGATLDDPHWIDPGWTLVLPEPAPTPSSIAVDPQPSASPTPPATEPTSIPAPLAPDGESGPPSVAPGKPAVAVPSPHTQDRNNDTSSVAPIRLPSGSVVAASFAAGVLSSLALGRLRRRHAYRYRPPEPGRTLTPDPPQTFVQDLLAATAPEDPEDIGQAHSFPGPARLVEDDPAVREEPDRIEIGVRDGRPVFWTLSDLAGLTLSGSGALGVVRAWVSALLVRAGPIGAQVLITATALNRLAPGCGANTAGIRSVPTTTAVLELLEGEVLARSRQLEDAYAHDAATYRHTHPRDPLPVAVAVVDAIAPDETGRILPILSDARRLGLGVIVLDGTSDAGIRITLDDSNVVVGSTPERLIQPLGGTQLFTLTSDEMHDVLAVLEASEERPDSLPTDDIVISPEVTPLYPNDGHSPNLDPASGGNDAENSWPTLDPGLESEPVIRIDVLGSLQISVAGEVVSTGLRTPAKELLLWYLLRPEGASVEAAVEQLWPDTDPERVHKQFWIGASNLRTRLGAQAVPPTRLLVQSGEVYCLDLEALGSDLWEFQAALDRAARSDDDATTAECLRRAVGSCRGEPFSGLDFSWIEPVRQDLHRRVVDVHLRLAEIEVGLGKQDAAVTTLENVIDFDRYAEEPYRRLMTLQHQLDRPDSFQATWKLLKDRLAEIDVDMEASTLQLYRRLSAPRGPQLDQNRLQVSS